MRNVHDFTMFSSRVSIVSSLTFKLLILSLFLYKKVVQFQFFVHSGPVFSMSFIKWALFTPSYDFAFFVEY